ncbi:MAG: hypothetical protein ACRCS9_13860 [Hyphomicrobium sp.]
MHASTPRDSISQIIADLMVSADDVTAPGPQAVDVQAIALLPTRIAAFKITAPAAHMFASALANLATCSYERRWKWLAIVSALRPLAEEELEQAEAASETIHRMAGVRFS